MRVCISVCACECEYVCACECVCVRTTGPVCRACGPAVSALQASLPRGSTPRTLFRFLFYLCCAQHATLLSGLPSRSWRKGQKWFSEILTAAPSRMTQVCDQAAWSPRPGCCPVFAPEGRDLGWGPGSASLWGYRETPTTLSFRGGCNTRMQNAD